MEELSNPYNRTRLPLMKDLKKRISNESKLLSRKSIILKWRKDRKKEGEELDEREKKFADSVAVHRANLNTLSEEFKLVQMNKTGSPFFQWMPNKGMNRKQARGFRKESNKIRNRVTNRVPA